MKTTLSVIKADIGSIGGHICPSQRLCARHGAGGGGISYFMEMLEKLDKKFQVRDPTTHARAARR